MIEILQKIYDYLQYPFVVYALIVGVLIALSAALLGVILVLKRFSYIGDGLSHVAFGGLAVASILNITNNIPFIIIVTAICAILLLRRGQNAKIKGDASLAMLSVGTMAVGYLLLNVFTPTGNLAGDVCTTLFGSTSILTLSQADVWTCVGLSLLVVLVFIFLYNKIFAVTFDENFSTAVGTKVGIYNLLIAVITSVIIVIAMRLVGSLLITALVIFPAISTMRVFKSFKQVIISSAIFGILAAIIGMLVSILVGTPVGSTIVVVDIIFFAIFSIVGKLKRG